MREHWNPLKGLSEDGSMYNRAIIRLVYILTPLEKQEKKHPHRTICPCTCSLKNRIVTLIISKFYTIFQTGKCEVETFYDHTT